MNEQLQQQLAEYLKAVLTTAQSGVSFVAEQAPIVVQERIAYGRVEEPVLLLLVIVLTVVFARLVMWGARNVNNDDCEGRAVAAMVIGGIAGIITFCLIFVGIDATVKVWLAPRLYVIEWAMSLVKK